MQWTATQLILKNNTAFQGLSPSYQVDWASGEVVFTTGMAGYIETLTDPSYTGQIIVFTYPLIGNYGVPPSSTWESKKIHAAGVVVSEACEQWSHSKSTQSLVSWLKEQNIPLITGVDTRALTKLLREKGVMLGGIQSKDTRNKIQTNSKSQISNLKFEDPNKINLVETVSIRSPKIYKGGKKKIIAVDCGMKENIIRELTKFNWTVMRVPYDYDYTKEKFDGVFLSNGPGDPAMMQKTVAILKKAMTLKKPIFGICLGSQLMGIAAGGKTYKLPYGHRGQNQPVIETATKKCFVTSQNHGFAVDEKTLPKDWFVNFRNLNDGSVEGVAHTRLPFFSAQFHPEAAPGPIDTNFLFRQFYQLVQ